MKNLIKSLGVIVLATIIVGGVVYAAGSLTPPAGSPSNTSYTLTDLDNLKTNTRVSPGSGPVPNAPAGNPTLTFRSITDVYNSLTTELNKLTPEKIVAGTTVFGIVGNAAVNPTALTWQSPISGTSTYHSLCYNNDAYTRGGTKPCVAGAPGSGFTVAGEGAVEYCANLNAEGSSNWRLPTREEARYALSYNFLLMRTTGGFRPGGLEPSYTGAGGAVYSMTSYWHDGRTNWLGTNLAMNATFNEISLNVQVDGYGDRRNRVAVRCVHN